MSLSAEQIESNFKELLNLVDEYITSPRKEQLKTLYLDHMDRIMFMPASGTDHHHNAFPGGYVDHIIRVVQCALEIKNLWQVAGSFIDYSDEELVFAALNHDLGKIGTEDAEQYIVNDSEWHRKNLGKLYKYNPDNAFMPVPERSLFLLQARGILVSFNEYLAIRIHDGLYDDANKPYYISHSKESKLRSNLPIIIHHADHMASRIEFEKWHNNEPQQKKQATNSSKLKPNIAESLTDEQKEDLKGVFDKLFN